MCALCEMLDVKVLSGSCTVKEHVDRLFDVSHVMKLYCSFVVFIKCLCLAGS